MPKDRRGHLETSLLVLDRFHEGRSVLPRGWDEPSLYVHSDEDIHILKLLNKHALSPHTVFPAVLHITCNSYNHR